MSSTLRLLIVDDDDVDRLAVRRLLRRVRPGAVIEESTDRASAEAAIRAGAFSCVLLDYNIPGTDGLRILEGIRRAGDHVPIIVLTGQGDEELAVTLMKAGASDYLNKNALTAERLDRSLRYALELHRAQQERAQLLEREQRAREEAQAANRAKDEFLATLSHELRTPLNAVLGWTHILRRRPLDDATRHALDVIERNATAQARLIDDLLDVSRIITGKLTLRVEPVDLRALSQAALDTLRPAAEAKGVRLDAELEAVPAFHGDPQRLQQVLWNLLSNAVKFTGGGGEVSMGLAADRHAFRITVADTGAGIAPDVLPYVFDRFTQGDSTSTRAQPGLGLGLAIVRYLVELHGGTVSAESQGPGTGATFRVWLPIRAAGQ